MVTEGGEEEFFGRAVGVGEVVGELFPEALGLGLRIRVAFESGYEDLKG